jgi:hypothetical protein
MNLTQYLKPNFILMEPHCLLLLLVVRIVTSYTNLIQFLKPHFILMQQVRPIACYCYVL